jgi:hypothetical protein
MARNDKRIDAYLAIDSERDYQDAGRGNANRDSSLPELTVGEHILIMRKLLNDAELAWYAPQGSTDALEHVRKIGGVATRCMEIWGAPLRKPS